MVHIGQPKPCACMAPLRRIQTPSLGLSYVRVIPASSSRTFVCVVHVHRPAAGLPASAICVSLGGDSARAYVVAYTHTCTYALRAHSVVSPRLPVHRHDTACVRMVNGQVIVGRRLLQLQEQRSCRDRSDDQRCRHPRFGGTYVQRVALGTGTGSRPVVPSLLQVSP